MADCSCGRSPTGKCVGWHSLSEEQYQEKKSIYDARLTSKSTTDKYIIWEVGSLQPPFFQGRMHDIYKK